MTNMRMLVRYEGYSVDIINEISQILGFNYTIKLVEDGAYGSYNKQTGKWNGMIGQEQQGKNNEMPRRVVSKGRRGGGGRLTEY
jgi:hypothetical protein